MSKTYAEELIEQGEARGIVRAKRDAILKLMRAKFGNVSASAVRRVRAMRSIRRLDVLLERVLFAESVDEILS